MRPLHGHTNDKRKESLTTEVKQMKLDYVNIFSRAVPFFVTKTRGKKKKGWGISSTPNTIRGPRCSYSWLKKQTAQVGGRMKKKKKNNSPLLW